MIRWEYKWYVEEKREQEEMGDLEQPLLENEGKRGFVEGCPGCQCAHLRRKGAGLPKMEMLIVANMMLCNSLPIAVVFPFLYFMVQDFNVAKSDDDIGYYAGWIGSSFMAGRALTGVLWGIIADKYGRKPVMFCGITSIIVFNTLFGLSETFYMAVASRFLLGSFNGLLGTLTAYSTEICSEEYMSFSVSLIGTMWGLGLIIGPALGGYLSQPALRYPGIFKDTIFDRYPYFLQALVISAYALVVLFSLFQLPETLHIHGKLDEVQSTTAADKSTSKVSLLKNRPLLCSIAVYCLWAFHDIAYSETFSLWAVSPKWTGGLGWTSADVGEVLALSGVALLIFQLGIFPGLANFFGPILLARTTAILAIPLLAIYPTLPGIQGSWLRVVVMTASLTKCCLGAATTTSSFLLVNNSVRRTQRGAANGLSLSMVSLFRALGPAAGGCVFAWAQTRRHASILPGDQLLFFFLCAAAFVAILATFEPFLPRSTNKPLPEDDSS